MEEEEATDNAREIVRNVIERGLFKARKPEGKGDGVGHH
jgi:tRNASer (uridine44-2'-O)-methyltransferase